MKMTDVVVAGGTVARTFDRSSDAQTAATRLRAAGFSDVRLSERSGKTAEAHVAPEAGATETDFAASLEQAGFASGDARVITTSVAQGAVLLTVIAGSRSDAALAVLRGEEVAPVVLSAVDPPRVPDTRPIEASAAAAAVTSVAAAPAATANTLEPGDQVIALRAERLDVSKERLTREARVRKETVTEERTITVPVTREQLVIERDGEATVRVPLSERPGPAATD